jgi:UDP-N-acetylmuramoylalanine--D-glutamate ligase
MKIGLVGWGVETQSAYRYFGDQHHYVIASEEPRDDFPISENVTIFALEQRRDPGLVGNVEDLSYLDHFDDCDMVMYQGAAHKNLEKKFPHDHHFWKKAKTSLDVFFEQSPSKKTIGITGTKGKGTTTTLIYRLLKDAGYDTVIGGNIGIPVLQLLADMTADTWVVLELSSFQLYKFNYSPHIAVHLMMLHEHIEEWHKTMDDYVQAKRNIFLHQSTDDIAVYYPENQYSSENVSYTSGKKIPYLSPPGASIIDNQIVIDGNKLIAIQDVGLRGSHNLQNICAAVTAVWQVHQDTSVYRNVLAAFTGLEHRLESAGEIHGVRYFDDSFGTTPDTAIVAMNAFTEKKVMIVGGHDKGNNMTAMCKRLASDDIRHIIFIGTIGRALYDATIAAGYNAENASVREDGNTWTMSEIVTLAQEKAEPGDVVLLSTGSSSFGIFKDYKDRGNQFKLAVGHLQSEL